MAKRVSSRVRRPADFAALTPGEQLLLRLWDQLDAQVNNGGIDQFLRNSSGDYAEEIRADLRRIGAGATAAVLDRAAAWFPEGVIPADPDARFDDLVRAEDTDPDEFEPLGDELTQAYRAAQAELYDRLLDFVEQHRAEFAEPRL